MKNPTFEHRHYKALAAIIAAVRQDSRADQATLNILAAHLVVEFKADNDRFQRDRFMSAANGEPCNGRDRVRA